MRVTTWDASADAKYGHFILLAALSNDRWEIEIALPDDAEIGSDEETASHWELLCDASDDDVNALLEDLDRVKQGLLGSGASRVHVDRLDD